MQNATLIDLHRGHQLKGALEVAGKRRIQVQRQRLNAGKFEMLGVQFNGP